MLTKIEMQYMDAVIQLNRRQKYNEIDWEDRRFELIKSALTVVPMGWNFEEDGEPSPKTIAKKAIKIADTLIAELMTTEVYK